MWLRFFQLLETEFVQRKLTFNQDSDKCKKIKLKPWWFLRSFTHVITSVRGQEHREGQHRASDRVRGGQSVLCLHPALKPEGGRRRTWPLDDVLECLPDVPVVSYQVQKRFSPNRSSYCCFVLLFKFKKIRFSITVDHFSPHV